ncbi:DUF7919 family protein [Aliidongia dinghuensis]
MYFPDLTPYEYGGAELQPNVLNVGWLSSAHSFPCGAPSDRLTDALRRLVASPVNLYRGSHRCEFCPPPPTKLSPGGMPMLASLPGTRGTARFGSKPKAELPT